MKIVVLDGFTVNPGDLSWQGLEALGSVTVYDRTPEAFVTERIEGADAVFTNKAPITRASIEACDTLRFIGVLATGYNIVDVEAAKKRAIPVCNIPAYGTAAVAQFTIALLLELCHHIGAHSDSVHRGDWTCNADWCYWNFPLVELAGKTMGIIGFGRIGQATAAIAKALGMKILAFDSCQSKSGEVMADYVTLEELLSHSDVISLHCPLSADTREIICKANIDKMKKGVLILNASRGWLVNERDLFEGLESGKVGGAALDVVSTEPIEANNILLKARNCLLTPHIAWAPKESRQRLMDMAVENLRSFTSGAMINNVWEKA